MSEKSRPVKKTAQPVTRVTLNKHFYRDSRHIMLLLLLLMALSLATSLGLNVYLLNNRPEPVYFATTADEQLFRLKPLIRPNQSAQVILSWANQAAVAAFTFDFLNYQQNFSDVRQYFTSDGYKNYLSALEESGTLKTVTAKRLVVKAVATDAPVIIKEGVISGRYSWKIEVPLVVRYESASERFTRPFLVQMLIVRVPTQETPTGIGIAQFIATERRGDSDYR